MTRQRIVVWQRSTSQLLYVWRAHPCILTWHRSTYNSKTVPWELWWNKTSQFQHGAHANQVYILKFIPFLYHIIFSYTTRPEFHLLQNCHLCCFNFFNKQCFSESAHNHLPKHVCNSVLRNWQIVEFTQINLFLTFTIKQTVKLLSWVALPIYTPTSKHRPSFSPTP